MGELEVRVGLVQRVPQPVALEVDRLRGRDAVALADEVRGSVAVRAVAVLVDVVADVQHEVQVVALPQRPVGGEVAAGVVAARDEREPQRVRVAGLVGCGLRPADDARLARRAEPVPVARVRPQPVHVDLDRVVGLRAGRLGALLDDVAEVLVVRELPPHAQRLAEPAARRGDRAARRLRRRRRPRPQHDRIAGRVAAGDPVAEDPAVRGRRRGLEVEGPEHRQARRAGGRGRGERGPLEDGAARRRRRRQTGGLVRGAGGLRGVGHETTACASRVNAGRRPGKCRPTGSTRGPTCGPAGALAPSLRR